jgi:hypothetical protein
MDMDHHLWAVDVADFQVAQLGPPDARGAQRHQDGAIEQIAGRIDEPGHFFLAQDRGQRYGGGGQLPLLDQIGLIGADVLQPELVRWPIEMLGRRPARPLRSRARYLESNYDAGVPPA